MTHKSFSHWLVAITLFISSPWLCAQERIISAGSAVTEILVALGAQNKLVAVDVTSEIPNDLALPKIGYHRQLSAEGLLALAPTQLIGSSEMGPESTLQQLKGAGVNVEVVNDESTPQGLLARIDQIATLADEKPQAKALKQQVQSTIAALTHQSTHKTPKKVLFLLIHEGRAANVAGSDTTPNSIIELAGAVNPAAEQVTSYKPLSMEAIIEMQPDVILVSGRSYEKLGGADAILQSIPTLVATPAGINKQIITIDGHALVGGLGLKSLAEAQRLNALLYP
ncbi:heme/hemin ABC transporter substrate-binding protein [Vibrio anguillarum]|uniref:heme/hemin ABC transporter substrate-binding protein n=1 Tax=Vibrio TaxID=662 RepID=UPI0002E31967|nr:MULTISPECIES: ABC transporter substrate-binding protein [Vibrio]MDQ2190893.1 hemin ABC transporter substrate-binding protein [Vibrio sp. A14(2019)]MDQ2196647.1 hemin ABC transporter substrate-binding protein [Vibrio sp. 2017_1457_11]NNN75864.1 hemin ABC transporter substrate-binding protein [Vibrio sp. B7]NNN92593.1 hemin ABC transporter substrate-binding protein [Vibrio sp. B8-1]NNO07954.1 hemin ABC transporter substrate-binding protein [Vibrio sp. B4-12]